MLLLRAVCVCQVAAGKMWLVLLGMAICLHSVADFIKLNPEAEKVHPGALPLSLHHPSVLEEGQICCCCHCCCSVFPVLLLEMTRIMGFGHIPDCWLGHCSKKGHLDLAWVGVDG